MGGMFAMIGGKIMFGPYNEFGAELTITDEGVHFEGKTARVGSFRKERVEIDAAFSEITNVKTVMGNINFECKGYLIIWGRMKQYKDAFEYIKNQGLTQAQVAEKKKEWEEHLDDEHIMRCKICGHIFCYTNRDAESNRQLEMDILDKELSAARNTLFVSRVTGGAEYQQAETMRSRVKDFKHCPKCHSAELEEISKEEQAKAQAPAAPAPAVFAMDELKKLKELLDLGIVTQEEFDQKKKQLLGL
ncbi:MAG: hypothetical protein E7333_05465 [Clostridiales bacterium]|nr:hypothetical protein [Clostridiales bacterium]